MSSLVRIAANRANGAKSRGPVTPEGKRISAANVIHSTGPRTPEGKARASQNALKHGMLSQSVVLRNECPDSFENAHCSLRDELQPRSYIDNELVEIMAAAHWRRKRSWCIEKDQFDHAIEAIEVIESPVEPNASQENSENAAPPSLQTALAFSALCSKSPTLKTLRRYEVTNSREFLRHLSIYESRRRESDFSKRTEPKTG